VDPEGITPAVRPLLDAETLSLYASIVSGSFIICASCCVVRCGVFGTAESGVESEPDYRRRRIWTPPGVLDSPVPLPP